MNFKRIVEELDDINKRYRGLPDKTDDMIDEVREVMTIAGSMLHDMISKKRIPHPKTQSPWFRFIFNDDGTRFKDIMYPNGICGQSYTVINKKKIVYIQFNDLLWHFYGFARTSVQYPREEMESFKHRHLFLEAIATWLPKHYPNYLRKLSLQKYKVITDKGKTIYFDSDWALPEKIAKKSSFIIPVVRAIRQACILLDDLSKKRRRSKKKAKKKSPAKERQQNGKSKGNQHRDIEWIPINDFCKQKGIPRATAQGWRNKFKDEDIRIHEVLNIVEVKKEVLKDRYDRYKRWKRSRRN